MGPNFVPPHLFSPASWFSGRPQPPATLASRTVPQPIDVDWWSLFHDPELTSLERRVAYANLDVRTATIRLAESREQRAIVSASAFPAVNGNASYTREKPSQEGVLSLTPAGGATGANGASQGTIANGTGSGVGVPNPIFQPFDLWQYGFDASWELDLWGKVRREIESANASVQASADARRAALISVLAEVARDYLNLRGTQTALRIQRENLKTAQESLRLTQERAAGGLTSDLDVANAAAQVASTQAQIPALQQQEAEQINALSFLLGDTPGALRSELATFKPVPPVPPKVPVGLPSELARRRPDIRQAEAQLHSATADIGVAVADFYPQITLSGSVSLQALQFKDLGNWAARQYAFGPGITLPIFRGGELRGTLELRKAQQREAAVNYQRTVLRAWHDVDNALTAYADEQRRRAALGVAVQQSQRALALARDRYAQGLADFLQVLDAERTLLSAEQQYASSTTTVSTNLVQLYKALGGGWETTFPVQHHKKAKA